jgi:hypothetical protein
MYVSPSRDPGEEAYTLIDGRLKLLDVRTELQAKFQLQSSNRKVPYQLR